MRSGPLVLPHSPAVVLAVLSCLVTAAAADEMPGAPSFSDRACGTLEPTLFEAQAIQSQFEQAQGPSLQSTVGGVIQVAFHVLHDGVEGNVTDAQIQTQIAEMNLDFSGASGGYDTGYRFVLTSVDRTLNASWFNLVQGSQDEKRAKEALNVDPMHHLNIYTAKFGALGWSTFPWGIAEDDPHQGIVIHYGSLPGGYIVNFNMGRTATHEVGHYLGLFHTFFTGCTEPNDYVADTPAQAAQTTGCPDGPVDTCPLPGPDPIHNYLDYSYDVCYAEFTAGQDERMDGMVSTYRPHFLLPPVGVADEAARFRAVLRPVTPNPSAGSARLGFSVRREERVTLRIHDLAGRTVATLVDGVLPAGDYTRVFEPRGGASGVYFAELMAGEERISRRLVLTH